MTLTNEEFMSAIHMEIHAVRRLPKYQASIMEKNISKFVIEKFSDSCRECKEMGEKIKLTPQKDKVGIIKIVGNALKGE